MGQRIHEKGGPTTTSETIMMTQDPEVDNSILILRIDIILSNVCHLGIVWIWYTSSSVGYGVRIGEILILWYYPEL